MQNFGKIKNAFNEMLIEGIGNKANPNKLLFKNYIKTIKESEILKTQFLVYRNIEDKLDNDSVSANLFVSENLKLLEKFKISDIIKENEKLISLSDDVKLKLDESYDSSMATLHESISNLICTKRTPKSINMVTKNISSIVDYIKNNKPKQITEVIDLPVSMLSALMVDKFNERYSNLDESDKKILKVLINSTNIEKNDLYTNTIRECIDIINVKLPDSDLETKDRLLRVKDKLLNDTKEINEDFIKKITKLIELKSSLNG